MTECRTDGTSAFNTHTEQRRLLLLDPAREGEVDGDPAARRRGGGSSGIPTGLRCGRREVCHGREREAPGLRYCCPPFPPLYIGPRERGGRSLSPSFKEGCGQGGVLPPKAPRRCLPPLGLSVFLISWRMGLLGLVPLAHIGQGAHPYSPCAPRGWWTPGPLSALPVQYR